MSRHQDSIVRGLEQRLLGIQEKLDVEKAKGWMTRRTTVEELTAEYHRIHRKWMAAKGQTALDLDV